MVSVYTPAQDSTEVRKMSSEVAWGITGSMMIHCCCCQWLSVISCCGGGCCLFSFLLVPPSVFIFSYFCNKALLIISANLFSVLEKKRNPFNLSGCVNYEIILPCVHTVCLSPVFNLWAPFWMTALFLYSVPMAREGSGDQNICKSAEACQNVVGRGKR